MKAKPMKVSSILKSKGGDVHTIRPQETIKTVIKKFEEKNIGALVVSDNYVEVQGMISERDIILAIAKHGREVSTMTVADVMQKGTTCSPEADYRG